MPRAGKKQRLRGRVTPRAKVWLEVDGQYVFGRGISDILKAVAETGSIKAAAIELGKSYRHVWAKIKETEQALGAPLVDSRVGGKDARRSDLTELGADLVRDFDALRDQTLDLVREEFQRRVRSTLARHRRG
ncbi:MAG: LysR family transcriptional regulator [Planctomycetota bacterium]